MIHGEVLRENREKNGISENELNKLAKKIGVSIDFLKDLEDEKIDYEYINEYYKCGMITLDTICNLCREYSIDPITFFAGEDKLIKECQKTWNKKNAKTKNNKNDSKGEALIKTNKNTIIGKIKIGLGVLLTILTFGKIGYEIGKNSNPVQKEINEQMDEIEDDDEKRTNMVKKILAEKLSSAYNMAIKPDNIGFKLCKGEEDGFNIIVCPQNKDMRAAVPMGLGEGKSGLNYYNPETDYYITVEVTDNLQNVLMKTSFTAFEDKVYKTVPFGLYRPYVEDYNTDDAMFALVKDDEPILHALLDSQSGKENIDQYIERYLNDIGKDAVKDAVKDATTDTVVGRVTSEVTKMFPNISFDDTNGMEKEDDLLNDK